MELFISLGKNMPDEPTLDPKAREAVHAQRDAAYTVELAREAQLARAIEEVAQRTKHDVIEGLREVFGNSDSEDPGRMKVLVRRIPLICQDIAQMRDDVQEMKDSQKWATRIIIGLFIAAVAKMVFLP